jgi:hypothetical protein
MLGFETSAQIDRFLKAHGVWLDYPPKTSSANAPAYTVSASDAFGYRGHQSNSLPGANRSD